MGEYTFTVRIEAPPEAVWALWTDLERMHEWVEGISKVGVVAGRPGTVGATYAVWFGRMKSSAEVLEAEPPRHIRTRISGRLLSGENEATLEPDGAGTRLTQRFRTDGLVAAVMGRIFATGSYKGSFRGELQTFVRLAEREARTGSAGAGSGSSEAAQG